MLLVNFSRDYFMISDQNVLQLMIMLEYRRERYLFYSLYLCFSFIFKLKGSG